MRACILSIGSEIMLGQITDTNASWLARDLADAGIELRSVMQVGDDFNPEVGFLPRRGYRLLMPARLLGPQKAISEQASA